MLETLSSAYPVVDLQVEDRSIDQAVFHERVVVRGDERLLSKTYE